CPQELQCEGSCTRGIKGESVGIGYLERFVADYHREHGEDREVDIKPNGKRVAVIGAGPSGLTCAGDLAKLGYDITVFEAFHTAGGVLVYGIPEFRLPKAIVAHEVEGLKRLGVKIMTDMVIGKVLTVDDLFDMGFKAVFIGSGAGLPMFMGIEGENALGVYSANEFLTRINLMKAYLDGYDTPVKKINSVAIIGGGNVAMDAARCAKRTGAKHVYVVYRRGEEEMPARREEVKHAKEEEIEFKFLSNPVRILSDENTRVTGIECVKMKLGEPDSSGRRRPEKIENSEFILDVDAVIMALGTSPNPLLTGTAKDISVNQRGCIIVDEDMMTSKENVYAGGDSVSGAATVIDAMGAGKRAAAAIDRKLKDR
ncbi:MAG: FAD-dependent oxidoreductase, partial [Clostridia bacterium]|nr:FAD-dependent oxidoreductase [Clostridia bacterium]